VQAHKADSLAFYFRKWANGPMGRAVNVLLIPLLRGWVTRRGRS
jgi:hypothetical protein